LLGELRLRRAFRYLKRGVFPPDDIVDFTCGRGEQVSAIEHKLGEVAEGASREIFVEGSYGEGKSHVLRLAEAIALTQGFAVCWVTLDGYQHAFNHPARYLHAFCENIRVKDSAERGLAALLRQWLRTGRRDELIAWANRAPSWLGWATLQLLDIDEADARLVWLNAIVESRDIVYRTGRSRMLSTVGRFAEVARLARAAGCSGVAYLFDELETVATLLGNARQRFLSYEVLNELCDSRKHAHCCFVFAGTPDFDGMIASDRYLIPRYMDEYPSGCRFIEKWRQSQLCRMPLSILGKGDMVGLYTLMRRQHEKAYGWRASDRITDGFVDQLANAAQRYGWGYREATRTFVHILELAEQHREAHAEALFPGLQL
jgi:hypothetical protein